MEHGPQCSCLKRVLYFRLQPSVPRQLFGFIHPPKLEAADGALEALRDALQACAAEPTSVHNVELELDDRPHVALTNVKVRESPPP